VRFVGVDLAWTSRGRTGLCAVEDGAVLASDTVTSDRELIEWLTPLSKGDVLIAIDAPLIVRNETGRRPCDQLISRCFGRYHASTHSANLRLPSFREGVRGELLAHALGISVDPVFEVKQDVRRAIEVYPHTAIVALFGLAHTLKYKAKPGRTVASRRLALMQLLGHLESLRDLDPPLDVTTTPRWAQIVDAVQNASAPIHLARVEDEIDAHVCAYTALYFWTHGTKLSRVAGDVTEGYIVTPVSPDQGDCLDRLMAVVETGPRVEPPLPDHVGMTFEETLAELLSLLGENVVVILRARGALEGDHVAALYGLLESGHDYGASDGARLVLDVGLPLHLPLDNAIVLPPVRGLSGDDNSLPVS
jgi:predicted RNase H-like nuclease